MLQEILNTQKLVYSSSYNNIEMVKTEDIEEKVTDSSSKIKVSSDIKFMEQVNFKCDISMNEEGLEFIKCEKSPEGKNTCDDTERRIKTEAKDEVDTQEHEVNYEHLRSIETGDYKVDFEHIVVKEDTVDILSVKEAGSVKCEINPKGEEYDTEIRIKTEIKDEVDVGHGVHYEPLRSIKIEDYKIQPEQKCMEEAVTDIRRILSNKLSYNHGQYVNDMETIKHEQMVGTDDTDGIEVCTEKQNIVQQCEPNCCEYEYKTGGVGKYEIKDEDMNLQTCVKVTHEGNVKHLKCLYCNYITKHRSSIKIHFITKHNKNTELYQCSDCDYKTRYKRYLLDHHKWKHDNAAEIFHCEQCDFKTKAKYNLLRHHKLKHDDTAEVFRCEQCEYKTKQHQRLLQHYRSKHDDSAEVLLCNLCEFKTKIKYNLLRHHRSQHDDSAEILVCKLCDYKTKTKGHLLEHHRIKHNAAESFHCEQCDFKTKYKNYLLRHQKSKHGDAAGIFHCERCDFKTKYRCNFWEHRKLKH